MNKFLAEFAKYIGNQKIVIIMDGAGWHKSSLLQIPENMRIIFQPPYSPELNPIEKLWQYIKERTIKNQIFETLKEIEKVVCNYIQTLSPEIIKSVCKVTYL